MKRSTTTSEDLITISKRAWSTRPARQLAISVMALGLVLTGCSTTGIESNQGGANRPSGGADATVKRREIASGVDNTLARMTTELRGSKELLAKASGVLVFPSVLAAGFVVGGEYGEGELRVGGKSAGFYRTTSASVGLQAGAQSKAVVFLFMTQQALDKFRSGEGWSAGVDASVAVLRVGANGDIDTTTAQGPVVGFVLTNAGLMANLSLEGTKVSRLAI